MSCSNICHCKVLHYFLKCIFVDAVVIIFDHSIFDLFRSKYRIFAKEVFQIFIRLFAGSQFQLICYQIKWLVLYDRSSDHSIYKNDG